MVVIIILLIFVVNFKMYCMINLARKGGLIWIVLGIVPMGSIVIEILKYFKIDIDIVLSISMIPLLLQVFSLFIVIKYWKELFFKYKH